MKREKRRVESEERKVKREEWKVKSEERKVNGEERRESGICWRITGDVFEKQHRNCGENCGETIRLIKRKPKRILAPSIGAVISDNDYVSEIMDKYQVNAFHENVGLPAS